MKYFTPKRYMALQITDDDNALDSAEQEWENAVDQYSAHLKSNRMKLTDNVRHLLDEFFLHDANVLSMGSNGNTFVIALQLDTPPNALVTITYDLVAHPDVLYDALPEQYCSTTPGWLYDEIECVNESTFEHAVLFSNGWELRLRFRDLRTALMDPMFPRAGAKAESPSI